MTYRTLYKGESLTDRERKNIILLDVIRRNGPIAKTDISRITKYNIVTVSNYVEHYIKKKLVVEHGLDVSSGGRRPELIELNPDWGFIVGVDIGPERITSVLTTLVPKILHKEVVPRPKGHMENVMAEAIRLTHKVITESKVNAQKIKGVGVGISGVIDKNAGTVRDTDTERGGTVGNFVSAKSILENEFRVPISIANDASLAALAEKKLSLRIDDENILYMYSDVGSGLVSNNDLFWGSSWSAGEIQLNIENAGDLQFPPWVQDSHYFRSRGLDLGIIEDVKKLLEQKKHTGKLSELIQNDPKNLSLENIFQAAAQNDKVVSDVIDGNLKLLGLKVAYLTNFFNPEVVVIGGGIEKGGDYALNMVRRIF